MCDTLLSPPGTSIDGCMILAKNSDRPPNEAQNVTFAPARDYAPGATLRCTHIEIPQAERTHAVLLSRPYWMFGAEMGVNDRGVAMANEAVFTKEPFHKKNDRLTGMDMMRIALERCATAAAARDCIIELLARYGQGGAHALTGTLYYHNSFMIADPTEAYLLETAGDHWAWKRLTGAATISNCLSIGGDYDALSPGAGDHARKRGYTPKGGTLDFNRDFSDLLFTFFARGRSRAACTLEGLRAAAGPVTPSRMMELLRSHDTDGPFRPGRRPMERTCLHAGGFISTQSTGSMVAVLKKGLPPLVYLTGTSAPCLGLFKPHVLSPGPPMKEGPIASASNFGGVDIYGSAGARYSEGALWWRGEDIHRRVIRNYPALSPAVTGAFAPLERAITADIESRWMKGGAKGPAGACAGARGDMVRAVFAMADTLARNLDGKGTKKDIPLLPAFQWKGLNRRAGMPFE